MLKKDYDSLSDYVIYYCNFILIIVAAILTLVVSVIYKHEINYNIQLKLKNSNDYYGDMLEIQNGKIIFDDKLLSQDVDGISRVILDSTGHIVKGSIEKNFLNVISYHDGMIESVYEGKDEYYVYDTRIYLTDTIHPNISYVYIMRSYIRAKDMLAEYNRIRKIGYQSILLIMLSCICIVFFLSRKVKKPIQELGYMAEMIGESEDFSKRIDVEEDSFSEIRSLVKANNNLLEKAESMIEVQKRFSSDVAHELKTPMTVITAECQYARKYLTDNDEMKQALTVIEDQAIKTTQIITQLFQLTRLEQHQLKVDLEKIDIAELIYSVCDSEILLEIKDIKMNYDIESCYINADINLMMIAIRNIINNAAKYSEDHSEIFIECKQEGNKVIIRCQDYGSGIQAEEIKKIFYRFYRSDQSRSSEGLGLGLPITKNIVELHNGTIRVDSEYLKGSTFTLEFPC